MFAEGYVLESLEEFILNEDMGTLKRFKLPNRIIQQILRSGGWSVAGRDSDVDIVEIPNDPKKFSKLLKEDFKGGVITVDDHPRYFFKRESERKFQLYDLDSIRSYEKDEYEKKKEREARNREREAEKTAQNEGLNERRRGGYYNFEPGLKGSFSGQGLAEFIQGIEGDVKVELIREDKKREETRKARQDVRQSSVDNLDPLDSYWGSESNPSQQNRYKRYAEKKRLEIDKRVDDKKDDLKKALMDNFDKAWDEIIEDLRKGYAWKADKKGFGEELLKGVDLSGLKDLAKAYDAVEPKSGATGKDAARASRVLKKGGYI